MFPPRTLRVLALSFLLLGTPHALAQPPGMAPPPPPEVIVSTVKAESLPISYSFVGLTAPSKTVEVRARVQGFVETRDFEEGALVAKDDLLFTIDRLPFEADLDIAKAQVQQAEARVRLAEQETKRLKSVEVPGAVAGSDVDRQEADLAGATASLRLAKATQAKAELELGYTRVKSPITGFVAKAEKEIGSLVDAGQSSLLTQVQQMDPFYVSVRVSEREFLSLRAAEASGAQALANQAPFMEISFADGTVYAEHGALNFESAALNTETGTVELRASFANPKNKIKAGQFVNATLRGWVRDGAIVVAQRAVSQSPQGAFVYVVAAENKAEMRVVEPGAWVGENWIIENGLNAGDRVIVDGLMKVRPGIVVVPVEAAIANADQPTDASAKQ